MPRASSTTEVIIMLRNICYLFFSCTVCLLVAKFVVGRTLVPLEQQKPLVAKLELESDTTTVRYCDSKASVNARFKIKNRGGRRLTVNAKEFNCDCYLGRESSTTISPGQEGSVSLPISMHALARRSEVKLLLLTNDPAQPSVPVCIKVLGRPPLVPKGAVSVMQD